MDLLLHELAGRVSKQQMDIVHLRTGRLWLSVEIARTQKVPMRRIKDFWPKSMMCCWTFAMGKPLYRYEIPLHPHFQKIGGQTE